MGLEHWNGALVRWGDTAKIGTAPDQLFWTEEASSKLFWSQFFLDLSVFEDSLCCQCWGSILAGGREREGTEKGSIGRGIRGEPE